MKKSSVDSTLASTGSKGSLFCPTMVNAMNTTLGILKVFGTIDVHGLPLNDWILSVEMLFIRVVAVFRQRNPRSCERPFPDLGEASQLFDDADGVFAARPDIGTGAIDLSPALGKFVFPGACPTTFTPVSCNWLTDVDFALCLIQARRSRQLPKFAGVIAIKLVAPPRYQLRRFAPRCDRLHRRRQRVGSYIPLNAQPGRMERSQPSRSLVRLPIGKAPLV